MRAYRFLGLPDFNAGDPRYLVHRFAGLRAPSTPRASLVAGGSAGSMPVGPWNRAEKYLTVEGTISAASLAEMPTLNDALVAAFPATADVPVDVIDVTGGRDMRLFVRNYDQPEIEWRENRIHFEFPLVAADPYKYATTSLVGSMGVFTGQSWFRTYDPAGYWRTYNSLGFYREYEQEQASGTYPESAVLVSPGTASSRRVRVEVTGPLTAGDWWITNEATGARMWADVDLVAGQSLIFDCWSQSVTLNGTPVDDLVFGDFLTLEPGSNTFRLVSGTQTAGYASLIDALPAYE